METIVTDILVKTEGLQDALSENDLDKADSLLMARGQLLEQLAEIWPNETPAPLRLVAILDRVRELDSEMEATLSKRRDSVGDEISRLAQRRPQKKHGTQAPCILNRQA